MALIPLDLWTDIFSYLSPSDLCAPCFTSKTLQEAARRVIDSSILESSNWWRHSKRLPINSTAVVQWWTVWVRQPLKTEALAAARNDVVHIIDLLGWDDSQLSPRHKQITRRPKDNPAWDWKDILIEAIVAGSKKIITACLNRREAAPLQTSTICTTSFYRASEEGNLEMIRWLCDEDIEGLPSVPWPPELYVEMSGLAYQSAKGGHVHVMAWMKHRGHIDDEIAGQM